MVNLSQRAEIVKRMDSQFNSNLEMRRTLHALDQRAKAIYANCKLFQKVRVHRTGRSGLKTLTGHRLMILFRNSKITTTMFSISSKAPDQTDPQSKQFWNVPT